MHPETGLTTGLRGGGRKAGAERGGGGNDRAGVAREAGDGLAVLGGSARRVIGAGDDEERAG